MTTQPTPLEIAECKDVQGQRLGDLSYASWTDPGARRLLLHDLAQFGYVIVHPEDVPRQSYEGPDGRTWARGYNRARRDIFGDTP